MFFNTSIFFTAVTIGFLVVFGVGIGVYVTRNHTWIPMRVLGAIMIVVSIATIVALVVRP